jgi:hypothetical protein
LNVITEAGMSMFSISLIGLPMSVVSSSANSSALSSISLANL